MQIIKAIFVRGGYVFSTEISPMQIFCDKNICLCCHVLKAKIRISIFLVCLVLIISVNPELETTSISLVS